MNASRRATNSAAQNAASYGFGVAVCQAARALAASGLQRGNP
jgi:hypothetical protein